MQVHELMTPDVEVIRPDDTLQTAAKMMADIDAGILPVGENDRLVGMITDRDITVRAVAEGRDPDKTMVRDAMSDAVRYCFEDEDAEEVARKMGSWQIRRLPVLNRGQAAGRHRLARRHGDWRFRGSGQGSLEGNFAGLERGRSGWTGSQGSSL